jgi:H+/Cl- antiporter ClcA
VSRQHKNTFEDLGDFTVTARVIPISLLAVGIGVLSTLVAWALLRLIALFTNAFYYGRFGTTLVSPAGNHLGWYAVLVPVAGGLIIGFMAYYGSERIRGHGIPEALESILINGSKVQPRLAVLKPISSAISIGSGGPFGAEGPIIMTGGAIGSVIAQLFHLTATERKTLLVAGAAAGMSATFATPIAAVLLAVELLLFEWKPRSAIPVALASATACAARRYVLGLGPLFPVPPHAMFIGPQGLAGCVIGGLLAGCLSSVLTLGVYAAEDSFLKLPVHWKWWPAIGGLAVGLGGLIFPQALGVGYDTIRSLLQGDATMGVLAGVLMVKCWWQRARGPKWQRREEPRCHWSMAAGAPAGWRVGAGSLIGRREFRMGFTQAVERQGEKANWLGEKEPGRCPGLDDEPLRRTKLFLPTGLRVLRCCRRSSVGTALPHSSSTCGRTGPSRSLGHR